MTLKHHTSRSRSGKPPKTSQSARTSFASSKTGTKAAHRTAKPSRTVQSGKTSQFNPGKSSSRSPTTNSSHLAPPSSQTPESIAHDKEHMEFFKPQPGVQLGEKYRTPVVTLTASEDDQDRRIDNFLISILPDIPKSNFYKLLRKGEIRVNKGRIKPEYKIQQGDQIRIAPLELVHKQDKTLTLQNVVNLNSVQSLVKNIVYQDKDMIIINKPAGIAVHGGSGVSYGVIEALRVMFPREKRLELVHRIDRDTSGLLIIAKKPSILKNLQDQFRRKTIHKKYYCLVPGKWTVNTVQAALKDYRNNGEKFVEVNELDGKPSVTDFQVNGYYRDNDDNVFSFITASPRTGRTHQIRVHCLHALAALVGDQKYSSLPELSYYKKQGWNRMFLHAYSLDFTDPATNQRKLVTIPLAPELQAILDSMQEVHSPSSNKHI